MIKRILFIIFFIFSVFFINNIFTEEVNAQSRISFCSTYADSQAPGATCKFSCGDFTYATLRSAISNNATAKCTGRATNFKITIRKLELGTSSGYNATGDNARCEIFNGTLVTNVGPASPDQVLANKPLTFNLAVVSKGEPSSFITIVPNSVYISMICLELLEITKAGCKCIVSTLLR